MQIKVGGKYKNRKGETVIISGKSYSTLFVFKDENGENYRENGQWGRAESEKDLIEKIIEVEDGFYNLSGSFFFGTSGGYLVEKKNKKLYFHYFQGGSGEGENWDEDHESFVRNGHWTKTEIPANTTNPYLLSKLSMNIKKARIKINSEEERLILKGFFELQGWRPSDMIDWKGTFPFYGYDENFGRMNAWPEGTTSGVCYASLNDFFLKKPIVKYKEFKLNDKYTAHIYPDRVIVEDIKVSFDTIKELAALLPFR